MNSKHKQELVDFLIQNRLVNFEVKEQIFDEEYVPDEGEEMSVTASGISYPKKMVMKYLLDNGISITPENVELVVKKLQKEGKLSKQRRETVYLSAINDATDEELRDALDLGIAKLLSSLVDNEIYNMADYDFRYAINYFVDGPSGILPVDQIAEDISKMKADGWIVKNMFTKNSRIISKGVATQSVAVGTQEVQGVLYIVYEKRFRR